MISMLQPAIRKILRLGLLAAGLLIAALILTLSIVAAQTSRAPQIGVSVAELVFAGTTVKTSIPAQPIVIRNTGDQTLTITSIAMAGTNGSSFDILNLPTFPLNLAPNATHTINVRFLTGGSSGQREASVLISASNATAVSVPVYGLRATGLEGGNEPTLANVVKTLGININVGWTGLANGTSPNPIGDEVLMPLMIKAGSGPVTIRTVGRYSPNRKIPYGYYFPNGTSTPNRNEVNAISVSVAETEQYPPNHQTLNPRTDTAAVTFDPGSAQFGIYVLGLENRYSYTEDALNAGGPALHAVRIYPLKNRSGVLVPNSYLIAFEDASNGDYQDYMFVISNVRDPNAPPPTHTLTHTPTNTATHTATHTATSISPTDTPDDPPTLSPVTVTTEAPTEVTETPSLPLTETPVTPTITGTPYTETPRPQQTTELLVNSAMEADVDFDGQPDVWKVKNADGDKLKCNKPEKNKTFAFAGDCAFMFKGSSVENTRLVQKPRVDVINSYNQGRLLLSLYAKTPPVVNTRVKLVVQYTDPALEREKQILTIPASDVYMQQMAQVLINNDVAKIKLVVINETAQGKVFVDNLSLLWQTGPVSAADQSLIPLP